MAAMSKVIKRSSVDHGDVNPDTGFVEPHTRKAAIISSDKYEAKADAQAIRERAIQEAEQIRAEARAEVEDLKTRTYEEARARGYQDGKQTGAAELAAIVANASQRLQRIEAQAIPQLRDLAVTIARKILGRELEFTPEAVVDLVRTALADKARQRREIFLRVHPEDMQFLREHKAELIEVLSRAKEIGLREDPDVARHGVIIETDAGIIDAQLETQLAVFERILLDAD